MQRGGPSEIYVENTYKVQPMLQSRETVNNGWGLGKGRAPCQGLGFAFGCVLPYRELGLSLSLGFLWVRACV